MPHQTKTTSPGTTVAIAVLAAALTALTLVGLASPATAGSAGYSGTTTSGAITVRPGPDQLVFTDPAVHIDLAIDDRGGVLDATTAFAPTYSPTFVGTFGLVFYLGAVLTQQGAATGTIAPGGDVALTVDARLAVTVYSRLGATPDPATDQRFTGPGCFVDVSFDLSGHLDAGTGVLDLADPSFAIPAFPDGEANCWIATVALNDDVAGVDNAIHLTFGGALTTTTTSTTVPAGGLTTPGTPAGSTTSTTAPVPTTTPGGSGLNDGDGARRPSSVDRPRAVRGG